MKEVDVALTDFLITILCWVFAFLLSAAHFGSFEGRLVIAIFIFVGLSALVGGVVHGFGHRLSPAVHKLLWQLTLIGIVSCSVMLWLLAGHVFDIFIPLLAVATLLALIHIMAIIYNPQFLIAIISYVPAVLAVLLAFSFEWQAEEQGSALMCMGFLITLLAPIVQIAGWNIHRHFTANSFYHAIQAVGLALVFLGSQSWLTATTIA